VSEDNVISADRPLTAEDEVDTGKRVSLKDMWKAFSIEEEMGYDAPFVSFTWARWIALQGKAMQCFTRFQRAIEQHDAQKALLISLEAQHICLELHKEACAWISAPIEQ